MFFSLSNPEFELGWNIISSKQHPVVVGNADQLRKHAILFRPDVVFLDQYIYEQNELEFFHSIAKKCIFTFDDPGAKLSERHCQINALIHNTSTTPALREIVLPIPRLKPKSFGRPKKIFVSFGGHDHNCIMDRVLKILTNTEYELDIVCVPPSRHIVSDDILTTAKGTLLRVYVSPPNFDELLSECDFAITSGGLTFFQCLSEQLVTLALAQYPHQEAALVALEYTKAFKYIGLANTISDDVLRAEIISFITDDKEIERISNNVKLLEVGAGFKTINNMLNIQ